MELRSDLARTLRHMLGRAHCHHTAKHMIRVVKVAHIPGVELDGRIMRQRTGPKRFTPVNTSGVDARIGWWD